ncbi:hypothetical protein ACMA1I_05140 [Pontibacter sp. 13R65]|uniref:hypothetical protein n=1 Tax=Pontibacter sp. 13R65 TaxID=3127458 RepID=UPI00301D6E63
MSLPRVAFTRASCTSPGKIIFIPGTFWFDAVDDQGEKVEVRESRFDVDLKR